MHKKALEVLEILEQHGFIAYIVGGYVRDYLLDKKTLDIDICTNAKPKEIMDIFDMVTISDIQYGSVDIIYKNFKFDVTTFRKEIKYEDNRKPVKIKYINDVKKDLLRRDFTINTLCMNKSEEILDILNVRSDLEKKVIKTVGNPRYKIKEDSLRILRAIRFATILDFKIDDKTKHYLTKYGYLLKKLSYNRKKEELNKIFSSPNKEIGRNLIIELKLDKHLELFNLKNIILCDDIIGIWSQFDVNDVYPFSKLEKEQMNGIRELSKLDSIDTFSLYKYGLYICSVVVDIKKESKSDITKRYNELPIYSLNDINIKPIEIAKILEKKPDKYLKDIMKDLENRILLGNVSNEYSKIEKYILEEYKKKS